MSITLGTHNTHDDAGVPTFFADAIGFTEAMAPNVKARHRARFAKAKARLRGYAIRVCTHQKDLVLALKRRHWKVTATKYYPVHGGIAKVTPHRGTFVVETRRRATGRREVFLLPHRINAAFPPYKRGEGMFRRARWQEHLELDNELIETYLADGWVVHAMGDVNTPPHVDGFPALTYEVGRGYDRIASSEPLGRVEYLRRMGSDHPRLRVALK